METFVCNNILIVLIIACTPEFISSPRMEVRNVRIKGHWWVAGGKKREACCQPGAREAPSR